MKHRLLLADDHAQVLVGLKKLLLTRAEFEIVGVVHDGHALVEAADALQPDVIVADISMPVLSGLKAAAEIRKRVPGAKIIFLTMHPELTYAVEAMRAGASGYVPKHAAGKELFEAIQVVLSGHAYVTPALLEPVRRALGWANEETAGEH